MIGFLNADIYSVNLLVNKVKFSLNLLKSVNEKESFNLILLSSLLACINIDPPSGFTNSKSLIK